MKQHKWCGGKNRLTREEVTRKKRQVDRDRHTQLQILIYLILKRKGTPQHDSRCNAGWKFEREGKVGPTERTQVALLAALCTVSMSIINRSWPCVTGDRYPFWTLSLPFNLLLFLPFFSITTIFFIFF